MFSYVLFYLFSSIPSRNQERGRDKTCRPRMPTSQPNNVVMFMFMGRVFILLPPLLLPPHIYHSPGDTYNSGDILRVVQIAGNFKKRVTWKTVERIMWSYLKDPTEVIEYSFTYFYTLYSRVPNLGTLLDEAYEKISVFIPAYKKPSPYNS